MLLGAMAAADAGAPAAAPQVLLAITNSQSMDGTTGGAIMVGSGSLGSSYSSLSSSTSPSTYTISDYGSFVPPLYSGTGGNAPWTVGCTAAGAYDSSASPKYLCDNGPSRMNMTKAAINLVLSTYGSSLNFGVYDYSTSWSLDGTWVYLMSPSSGGFTFTNTASTTPRTVANPCYGYSTASSSVSTPCGSIAAQYGSGVVAGNAYMVIGASSDDPLINDILYSPPGSVTAEVLNYGGPTPANPYTGTGSYTLAKYNCCYSSSYTEAYTSAAPATNGSGQSQAFSTTPTNAGYVPFSPQVLYSERGFGYYGSGESSTTGNIVVPMGTDPASSAFTAALLPETNNASTGEIKSAALQAATYGLLTGAKSYLTGLTKAASCQTQFVILLTDGLPTLDSKNQAWPPLGTSTAIAYGLTATYNSDGSFASSSSQAVTDAITAVKNLSAAGIKTFVIGLGAGVTPTNNPQANQLLTAMAIAGGTTKFYPATDSLSLSTAFVAVTDIIYKSSAVAAPVAPISVAGGTSYEYELTSIATPASGHVQAFAVAASGAASSADSWDAGDSTHMSTTLRGTALKAANAGGSVVALSSVDAAAFNLTSPTTCVPNVGTIVSYTIDPTYAAPSGCTTPYLGTRQSGWPLGVFSTQDTGRFMGPPESALLTARYGSYAAYARGLATRTPSVLFTDSDGFLYSINGSTGLLQWAWTSRSILAQLQNYTTFASSGSTNGNFTVVDALNSGASWGTYVVGSLQSGSEHFSVELDSSGSPTTVVYDSTISGGTSAGDVAGGTGTTPLRQPTIIAYVGNTAYNVYVVTVGSTSTLYESDVTSSSGTTSTSLGFKVSSVISLDASSNQLWLGGADGTIRYLRLSGAASSDVATMSTIGTVVTPCTSGTCTALANVLYVGYVEVSGIPYVYAANSAQITVFGISSAGWVPLWASTPSQGYSYNQATSLWVDSTTVTTMTASSSVSDLPIQVGPGLLVPTYVPGTACTAGTGYYDFFNFADGTFPSTGLTYNGALVTSDLYVGVGPAFTPSLTAITGGIALSPGSLGNPNPPTNPLKNLGGLGPRAISWTQH